MKLTKTFTADVYSAALESWTWIGLDNTTPVLSSLFGHLFLESAAGYWFLDVLSGELSLEWTDAASLNAALDSPQGQDEYLLGGLAISADRRGVHLQPNQVYVLTPPPALGGPITVANVTASDFVVAVNVAGQIHGQVRALPPGTEITGVSAQPAATPPSRTRFRRRPR